MDSAKHCPEQCRRLVKLARSEAEVRALKVIFRTWSGLAGQIDRYHSLVRERSRRA
jgi:hypothetical protein